MSRLALIKMLDRQKVQSAIVPLVLAIVVWAAHFYHYQQFSLYYEDYSRIPTAMQWEWSQIWEFWAEIPEAIIEAEFEGRPLHPGLIRLLARLGEQLGGLPAIYRVAYAINLLNVLLFYKLIQRSTRWPFLP
ncbi:MAG: hypothetical protein HC895_20165 [Leptolyngbyaceae cyanobacterium SM1_3_5]|nr:hypothetical protein [Leptolyngbyaceae cyanobacterium SM1_3_5]